MYEARPTPVLDTGLVDDLVGFTKSFLVLPTHNHELVLAIWVLHTWTLEAFNCTPYLYFFSSEPGSGKTRALEVLGILARNARAASDMTPSVMFKLISREQSTLLLDEVDTVWSGSRNDPLRRILATGYRKSGRAWREQARELIEFRTYSAKVLAGLDNGFMPAPIRDRCIPFELSRKPADQTVERFNEYAISHGPVAVELLNRIDTFQEAFFADVAVQEPEPMPMLTDRQDEICQPLLAIASVMGREPELRSALQSLFRESAKVKPNPRAIIMQRIRDIFGDDTRVFTDDLCEALGPAFANGRTLARYLEPFAIAPDQIRIGNQNRRGYRIEQFDVAFNTVLGSPRPDLHVVDKESEAAA